MRTAVLLFLLYSSAIIAQKNELKINLLKIGEVSYERRLNDRFSTGLHAGTGLFKIGDEQNRFTIKGFGRYYMSKDQNFSKFFLQLSFVYNRHEYFPSSDPDIWHRVGIYDEAGILAGVGYKVLLNEKFTVDLYIDVGPEFLNRSALLPVMADAGINAGYRF
ncbi:DUF3575 domain-containing protein [Chryseobacterium sp.]|uniref:DUF3575 domain-containing protein n=1 Tax=Chryseobacterium sp. TaxID=1871047 RepID=UPI0012A7DE93|nr:DUF3575 domain-containing protein [Chryseobacterium sp.]QFG53295.1 DUF3575 domain-containing protein [Chryseobacterium sp.]